MALFNLNSSKKNKKSTSFYDRENRILNASDLRCYFNSKADLSTTAEVNFIGISLDQITPDGVEDKLGEPDYILDHEYRIAGHKVYFYKKKVGNLTLLMQFHFIDDVFIVAITKFSSDFLLNNTDKIKLATQILQNYPDTTLQPSQLIIKFQDQQGNILFTEDNIFYYIHYVSNSKELQLLKSQIDWENLSKKTTECPDGSIDQFI